jgi:hypothetical protein
VSNQFPPSGYGASSNDGGEENGRQVFGSQNEYNQYGSNDYGSYSGDQYASQGDNYASPRSPSSVAVSGAASRCLAVAAMTTGTRPTMATVAKTGTVARRTAAARTVAATPSTTLSRTPTRSPASA